MADFSKKEYIKSNVWVGDEYLVQPETAVKRCRCCGKYFYTVEFPNVPEIVDGKLPVCIKCYRSKSYTDCVDEIVSGLQEVRICRKCEKELPIGQFGSYVKKYNKFDNVCQDCTPAKPRWWESSDEDDGDQ